MDILANQRQVVGYELGNRADLLQQAANGGPSRIDNWIWQAYLNLGMGWPFEQLEATVDGSWQASMDLIDYPSDCRAIKSIMFYNTNGLVINPQWKDMNYLRRYPVSLGGSSVPSNGPPSIVAPYGQQLFVRPLADQNVYTYKLDYWQKPTQLIDQDAPDATPPYTSLGTADIGATLLQVPDDWLEVIQLGAELRGHASLGEPEKANALQQLLYGYTIPTTNKFVPGLIATNWSRRQAQAPYMDYNIQPRSAKRGYTNTGS